MCRLNSFGPTASSVEGKADYSAFISNGVVSLPGQKEVAVKILRDIGALHSFVHESLFSISSKSNLGEGILIRGVGMTITPVSAHRLSLTCGLNGFRHRLFMAAKLARLRLRESQKKLKSVLDRKARQRQFSPMFLLPVVGSPFQAHFSSPGTVDRQVSEQDYLISLLKGGKRLC